MAEISAYMWYEEREPDFSKDVLGTVIYNDVVGLYWAYILNQKGDSIGHITFRRLVEFGRWALLHGAKKTTERQNCREFTMSFTKQKTITVSADAFLERDAVCHAEFEHDKKHYLVQVVPDMDALNPRECFDHEWTWTTTQNAGYSDSGAMRLDYWQYMEKAEREKYIAYPLSLLRHSGDTVYVGKNAHWTDPGGWDSRCMGVAYIPKKKAVQVWGSKYKNGEIVRQGTRLTKKVEQKAFECLKAEVAEMNTFLHNDVYGVMVTCLETEEDYESRWGFYCDDRDEICRHVKEALPAGMADEELNAVIEFLEWKW